LESQRAAELADVRPAEDDVDSADKGWEDAKGPRCDPQKTGLEPGEERNDGREVDVPEGGVPAACEVVELVDMETEDAVGGQVYGDQAGSRAAVEQVRRATGLSPRHPHGIVTYRMGRHRYRPSTRR
jgi:hypothetical protein